MKNRRCLARTDRLFLAKMQADDAPQAYKWAGDSKVTEFLRYSTYTNIEDLKKWIVSLTEKSNDLGVFLNDGTLIGSIGCGLCGRGEIRELGYCFNRDYWEKGYATEAAKAILGYTMERFGTREFTVRHALENARSQRVIEKCGFEFEKMSAYTKFDGSNSFESKEYILRANVFQMNLQNKPFEKIADGSKTVEMRLDDERRKGIAAGCFIIFTNESDGRKLAARVKSVCRYNSFGQLYAATDLTKCGYTSEEAKTASASDMLKYYSEEKQKRYSALAIEIEKWCVLEKK